LEQMAEAAEVAKSASWRGCFASLCVVARRVSYEGTVSQRYAAPDLYAGRSGGIRVEELSGGVRFARKGSRRRSRRRCGAHDGSHVRRTHPEWKSRMGECSHEVDGKLVEVFGDVREGDEVAVRGTDELRPGTHVNTQVATVAK